MLGDVRDVNHRCLSGVASRRGTQQLVHSEGDPDEEVRDHFLILRG